MTFPGLRGRLGTLAAAGLLLLTPGASPAQEQAPTARSTSAPALLRQIVEVRRGANEFGGKTQKRIDELSDRTDEAYGRYKSALSQLASLREYNQTMTELVGEQEAELASLTEQLEQVDAVSRSVTPLMLRMIDVLERFVSLDIPFLADERAERIQDLKRMMLRSDVTVSEKYRRIMEAYQIESEYGRTIEAYRAPLGADGNGATMDFLRFGRISLVYLSLDGNEAGVWNQESRSWQPLEASFVPEVRHGLRVARKQAAPDLIQLPLPQPELGE